MPATQSLASPPRVSPGLQDNRVVLVRSEPGLGLPREGGLRGGNACWSCLETHKLVPCCVRQQKSPSIAAHFVLKGQIQSCKGNSVNVRAW